jgi:hypothetical protein
MTYKPNWSDETLKTVLAMKNNGTKTADISKATGIAKGTILYAMWRMGKGNGTPRKIEYQEPREPSPPRRFSWEVAL